MPSKLIVQVIWVDLLTKAEFEAGFGSHTPMFSGQTKCVRYYMNFERALRLMKEVIAQEGHTFDANNNPGRFACCLCQLACAMSDRLLLLRHATWSFTQLGTTWQQSSSCSTTPFTTRCMVPVPVDGWVLHLGSSSNPMVLVGIASRNNACRLRCGEWRCKLSYLALCSPLQFWCMSSLVVCLAPLQQRPSCARLVFLACTYIFTVVL